MPHNHQKKIAVINDFSGFGRCSITAALPLISALKVQCCCVPTAIFSNHTQFESFYRADFTAHMEPYLDEWKKLGLTFEGILTGFLSSPEQVAIVERFLQRARTEQTVVVIDPVMGDNGALYPGYAPALAAQMRRLAAYADVLTPNLTEACILTGTPYCPQADAARLDALCRALAQIGPRRIVISGIERGEDLENFVWQAGEEPVVVQVHKVGGYRSGTGDAFSAIVAADTVNGIPLVDAVRHASAFIAKTLRRAIELELEKFDGLCFEEYLTEIGQMLS